MKSDRIDSARWWARFLLAITFFTISLTVVVADVLTGLTILSAVGLIGVLVGLAWMRRSYSAPTRYEGARWRFDDH